MAIDFTKIASLCVAQLNAAGTYTATPSDPRFYTGQIKDAINNADAAVLTLILSDPANPFRNRFITSAVVNHAAAIPAHIGPVVSVVVGGKGAMLWPKSEIEFEKTNPLTLTKIAAHYWIDQDNILFVNAASATVYFANFTQSVADPPVLQCPDGFGDAVACRALAFLFPVEGENVSAGQHYERLWAEFMQAIMQRKELPPLTEPA